MKSRRTPRAHTLKAASPVTLPADCALTATGIGLLSSTPEAAPTLFASYDFTSTNTTKESRRTCSESKIPRLSRLQGDELCFRRVIQPALFPSEKSHIGKKRVLSSAINLYGWPQKRKRCSNSAKAVTYSPPSKRKPYCTPKSTPFTGSTVFHCGATPQSECLTNIQAVRSRASITVKVHKVFSLPSISEMLSPCDIYTLSRTCRGVSPCFSVLRVPSHFASVYAAASKTRWTVQKAMRVLEDVSRTPFKTTRNIMRYYFYRVLSPSMLWEIAFKRNDVSGMRRALRGHLLTSSCLADV